MQNSGGLQPPLFLYPYFVVAADLQQNYRDVAPDFKQKHAVVAPDFKQKTFYIAIFLGVYMTYLML